MCEISKPIVLDERKQAAPITQDYVGSICSSDFKGTACLFEPQTMKLREGTQGSGGCGPLIQSNKSATLSTLNEQTLFEPKVYGICSQNSNAMRSGNANSGIVELEKSRTLDTGACSGNGGTVICMEGNGQRKSHKGSGFKADEAFTLNTSERMTVAYQNQVSTLTTELAKMVGNQGPEGGQLIVETFGNNGYGKWNSEVAPIKASGGDFQGSENVVVENRYAVRRLTPLECLRLQGMPDWWLDDIHIESPTAEQIDYWRAAFAELGKKKSDNQIRKFLAVPYADSNAYRAIGNGLAVPCAVWVMRGIVENSNVHNL